MKVLSNLLINAVVAFSSPDLSPVHLSPVMLAVLSQQAVKEEFLTALRSLSSGQPTPWLQLPFCLQPSLVPPSSCKVQASRTGCLCAGLPQSFCLSVCGLSLAQDTAEHRPHQRHFSAVPAEEALLLSMVCRLGPSNSAASGGCFLKWLMRSRASHWFFWGERYCISAG